jgi:alpha-N-arabinofuranosidase
MACQFNSGEVGSNGRAATIINDALDLIEFANGDPSSKWGKLRKDEYGHPKPYQYGIPRSVMSSGNPQYNERYKVFETADSCKIPYIKNRLGCGNLMRTSEYFNYA